MAAVCASRLIVYGAAAIGSLTLRREQGWTAVDPSHVTLSLGKVGNLLAASAVRWDALAYLHIAQNGYTKASYTVFFPMYPLLIRLFGAVFGSNVAAAMLISAVSFVLGLRLLYRLTELELDSRAADAAVLLLAFAPMSLFFTAAYTESLFLALSVGAFYAARRRPMGARRRARRTGDGHTGLWDPAGRRARSDRLSQPALGWTAGSPGCCRRRRR